MNPQEMQKVGEIVSSVVAKEIENLRVGFAKQLQILSKIAMNQRAREGSFGEVKFDTATSNKEGTFIVPQIMGWPAASSLQVLSVGGGALQILLPGANTWISVVVGDKITDEFIDSFRVRATTGAAGIAVFRLGAPQEE